jgi:hypothetical protein
MDGSNCLKGGDSVRNFLFTLKNPHAVPAQKFTLRADKKYDAIICNSAWGLIFTGCIDVYNDSNANTNMNTNTDSCICIGTRWNPLEPIGTHRNEYVYANDIAIPHFFTGVENFTVKEIEVFEIAN